MNYFISYDLYRPGQNYDAIGEAIKQLGAWAKVHLSLYYLSTNMALEQVYAAVAAASDPNDKVLVIGASSAHWNSLPPDVQAQIQGNWNR